MATLHGQLTENASVEIKLNTPGGASPHIEISNLVSTTEYAQLHGKSCRAVRDLVSRGSLKTAVKLGRNWMVDRTEPYPDRRVKSGAYRDWREKYPAKPSPED